MKTCCKCKQKKELIDFCKNKRYKDGRHDTCKSCRKKYNDENRDKIKTYEREWRKNNPNYNKEWRKNNPELYKALYIAGNARKTKEQIRITNKKLQSYKAKWSKKQYSTNNTFKLSQLLRIRLLDALKGKANKTESILSLIGCSLNECKQHLESQFKPEMAWDNHGTIWEIDHILPCSSFDLTDIEQQKQCFHYTNLQPLFKTSGVAKQLGYIHEIGNRNKSNKL